MSKHFGVFPKKWKIYETKLYQGDLLEVEREVDTVKYLITECFKDGPLESISLDVDVSIDELVDISKELKLKQS